MVYLLKTDTDRQAVKVHEEMYGTYNQFPPGWRSITPEEFAVSSFFIYGFLRTEYRQMHMYQDGTHAPKMIAAQLFFHDQGSFAISNNQQTKEVLYFQFGCTHEWEYMSHAKALERGVRLIGQDQARRCTKCDRMWVYDSSD